MATKIDWYGKEVKRKTVAAVTKKIRQSTFLVQADSILLAPVDTGRLRNSIDSETNLWLGTVYTNVEYAPYVELGTENMSAQSFLRASLFKNEENIKRIFDDNRL